MNGEENSQKDTSTNAEGAAGKAGAENATENKDAKFTQDDLDRIISERMKKAEAKKQSEIDGAVKRAIEDYDRKAKMTEAERVAEASKEREAEITRREQEVAIRENRNRAIEILREKKIPTSMVEHIATADADETDENIKKFAEDWSKALSEAIKDASKGSAPRDLRSTEDKSSEKSKTKYTGTQVL